MGQRFRGLFDALERLAAESDALPPALGLSRAGRIGRLRRALSRRWPTTAEVRLLFPHLSRRAARRIAGGVAAVAARDRWIVATLTRRGLGVVRELVDVGPALAALPPPAVLLTFHAGAWNALGAAIERLPARALSLRQDAVYAPPPGLEVAATRGDVQVRAHVFQRALVRLGEGGFVVAAGDVADAAAVAVPCLGRRLRLARGPFALARRAAAPLVPLTAEWRRDRIVAEVHPPLPAPELDARAAPERFDAALAAGAAEWLAGYLRARPEQTGLGLLRELVTAPPAEG